jgi:hypothetical protein
MIKVNDTYINIKIFIDIEQKIKRSLLIRNKNLYEHLHIEKYSHTGCQRKKFRTTKKCTQLQKTIEVCLKFVRYCY